MSRLKRSSFLFFSLSILVFAGGAAIAQSGNEVEMSGISGERTAPRRHFRLRDPARISAEKAESIYQIAVRALEAGYARANKSAVRSYLRWRRYNRAPYLSSTHGNHYINNYANETAADYGLFEKAGRLPVGSVIAKDSFSVTETGGVLLGSLFVMEKMPRGFNYVSGDWKYTLIQPDGRILGETNGPGSERVEYCIACHLAAEPQDHLFFMPPAYRNAGPE
ncbi:MAG TPA: cytochrome P460 family protein [Gammaproteobacteria bacterium]